MSEVDPVWAWGGQTSTSPGSTYFSEIFSPRHIKLTNNNPNKDFKPVEKFKLGRKIFSSFENKKKIMNGIRTKDL